ncbi:DUF5339 domain-containing protein [Gilliamella sp. Gris1-4]|uniref:DUF5339 domain-containing protein n=1 Tax=Gilliamella sp. Gris1-4 TaxID=3120244 RepID=UPI00080E59B6|nr:DUF5339 domain-containing protein [Gilliamella apicola]OCG38055.1 hypothetical protein A9G31_02790 [Gilliamella apicola]OCG68679.1 hypothetical protein A9G39_02100 [Gilliamella apicola]
MKKLVLSIVLLGLSSGAMADLSESCKTFFDKIDGLVKTIPEDAATKQQTDMIKQSLESNKQQISALPADKQEEACKLGIDSLKQLEASIPKK